MGQYSYDPEVQERYDRYISAEKELQSQLNDAAPNASRIIEAIEFLIEIMIERKLAGD